MAVIPSECGNCLELTSVGAPRRPVGVADAYPAEPPVPPIFFLISLVVEPASRSHVDSTLRAVLIVHAPLHRVGAGPRVPTSPRHWVSSDRRFGIHPDIHTSPGRRRCRQWSGVSCSSHGGFGPAHFTGYESSSSRRRPGGSWMLSFVGFVAPLRGAWRAAPACRYSCFARCNTERPAARPPVRARSASSGPWSAERSRGA